MNINTENMTMQDAFLKKDEDRTDKVLEEAQRLVNLYRHSRSFPPAFLSELDAKIIQASPEVQSAISRIIGGAEVRRYLDFLKEKNAYSTDTELENPKEEKTSSFVGYLPTPDEDIQPVSVTSNSDPYISNTITPDLKNLISDLINSRQSELEKLLQVQTDTLSKLLEQMDKQRQELAGNQTDRLINAIQQKTLEKKKYSDIIENTSPVFIPDDTEGF